MTIGKWTAFFPKRMELTNMWNQIWGVWKYSALKFRNSIEKWAPRCCWQWGGIQEDTWHFHPFRYDWVHILSNQSAFLDGALNAEWIIWELTKCRSLIAKSGNYEQPQNSKSFGFTHPLQIYNKSKFVKSSVLTNHHGFCGQMIAQKTHDRLKCQKVQKYSLMV